MIEIKDIIVTEDRQATTDAIAKKVNITTLVSSINVGLIEEGMNLDEKG